MAFALMMAMLVQEGKEEWFVVTDGPNKEVLGELFKDPLGELN